MAAREHHLGEPAADRPATREQTRTRRRAVGRGRVEVLEDRALRGEPIEPRRGGRLAAVRAEVAPAEVVEQDQHEIGTRAAPALRGIRDAAERRDLGAHLFERLGAVVAHDAQREPRGADQRGHEHEQHETAEETRETAQHAAEYTRAPTRGSLHEARPGAALGESAGEGAGRARAARRAPRLRLRLDGRDLRAGRDHATRLPRRPHEAHPARHRGDPGGGAHAGGHRARDGDGRPARGRRPRDHRRRALRPADRRRLVRAAVGRPTCAAPRLRDDHAQGAAERRPRRPRRQGDRPALSRARLVGPRQAAQERAAHRPEDADLPRHRHAREREAHRRAGRWLAADGIQPRDEGGVPAVARRGPRARGPEVGRPRDPGRLPGEHHERREGRARRAEAVHRALRGRHGREDQELPQGA